MLQALVLVLMLQAPPEKILSPSEVEMLAYDHLQKQPHDLQPYLRYLWLPNLSLKDRQDWRVVLNGHVNSLSTQSDLVPVVPIASGHLLVLNILDYGWKADVWEKFATSDPTFTVQLVTEREVEILQPYGRDDKNGNWVFVENRKEKVKKSVRAPVAAPWLIRSAASKLAVEGLRKLAHSQVPVVNAFVFFQTTASSGFGSPDYYDLQGIKDEASFQKLVGAEVAKDVEFSTDLLAAIGISGVTQEPRALQRIDKRGGALWRSFDNNKGKAVDNNNALRILGSEEGKLRLDFAATEQYAHGSNGLWKFLLANNKGVKQDRAPDLIAQDSEAIAHNNHSVVICVSCIRCHSNGGLQDIEDWVRNFPPEMDLLAGDRAGKKKIAYEEVRTLRQQYARKLAPYLTQDRAKYAAALLQITGLTPEKYALEFGVRWNEAVNVQVDLEWAARDLGIEANILAVAIKHQVLLGKADTTLAALVLPAARRRRLQVNQWREVYSLAQTYIAEVGK